MLFYAFICVVLCYLCCPMLICVVLCLFVLSYVLIVCTVPLPPGVNSIAIDKYIYLSIYLSIYDTQSIPLPLPAQTHHLVGKRIKEDILQTSNPHSGW